jgi:hypothetical protein
MSLFRPYPVQAAWPPFSITLTPTNDQRQITYRINLLNKLETPLEDVLIKVPIPEGTRFLDVNGPQGVDTAFDGAEVTFFTMLVHAGLDDLAFTVEVIDPDQTVVTTRAWLKWGGSLPGDYLTELSEINLSLPPLLWERPAPLPVQLAARATLLGGDGQLTYDIYPTNVTSNRMWDVHISLPLPAGTTFQSAEAPPSFVTVFDGVEVAFTSLELQSQTEVGPLRVTLAVDDATLPLVTFAWADWRNVDAAEAGWQGTRTADLVVRPASPQLVVVDDLGDTPFANYDLTSVVLQQIGPDLGIIFHTAGEIGATDELLAYAFYLDSDCQTETGRQENDRGVEYRLIYQHDKAETSLDAWDALAETWQPVAVQPIGSTDGLRTNLEDQAIEIWLPRALIETADGLLFSESSPSDTQFCWTAKAENRTKAFQSNLPIEIIPDSRDPRLTHHRFSASD